MTIKSSIRHRLRLLMLSGVIVTLLTTSLLMGVVMWNITLNVSEEYARLYTQEFVSDFQATLGREIGLSLKAANSRSLKRWMANESDSLLKENAFEEIKQVNQLLQDQNFFVAFNHSNNVYFTDSNTHLETLEPSITLSTTDPQDIWYFRTLASDAPYLLNIDIDRYLQSMRVWVNVNVVDEVSGEPLGIAGTGLYLDPLIKSIFTKHQKFGAKTVVINEYGDIQLDSEIENIAENSFSPSLAVDKTIFQFTDSPNFNDELKNYFNGNPSPKVFRINTGGYDFVGISPIKHTNWHVVTFFSIASLYNWSNFIPLILIAISTVLLMGLLVNVIFNRQFVIPFEKLRESIQLKDMLQDDVIFGMDRKDEFGVLAQTIQQMTERLMHSVSVGMFIIGKDYSIIYTNPYFLEQFKCSSKKAFESFLASRHYNIFKQPDDFLWVQQLFELSEDRYAIEVELINALDETFWADIRLTKIDVGDNAWHYEGILINIQHVKENVYNLTQLVEMDTLTGLYNRNYFETLLTELTLDRGQTQNLSLIFFDLDYFKRVNDTWGHDTGDVVLKETARISKTCLRASDALVRWGGEEFAVLMRDTDASGAMFVAEKIRKQLSIHVHEPAGIVTASFGVSQRLPHESQEEWFKRTDNALYAAKNAGRNLVILAETRKGVSFLRLHWTSTFNSGNETLDRQHLELFHYTEELIEMALSNSNRREIIDAFNRLADMTANHFEDEINLLHKSTYPKEAIARHHDLHQQLLARISTWQTQLTDPETKPFDILVEFLQQLVIEHLVKEDTLFFKYVDHL